jgi:hypothetical protein
MMRDITGTRGLSKSGGKTNAKWILQQLPLFFSIRRVQTVGELLPSREASPTLHLNGHQMGILGTENSARVARDGRQIVRE